MKLSENDLKCPNCNKRLLTRKERQYKHCLSCGYDFSLIKGKVEFTNENKKEVKIENNKVICKCGKDLGKFKEGKIYFCKECFISIGFINTYTNISLEDVFETEWTKDWYYVKGGKNY